MWFILNFDPCEYEHSPLIFHHQKHFITGDLKIIEKVKLQKFLIKSRNYRKPR